jgi:hypothetical protein
MQHRLQSHVRLLGYGGQVNRTREPLSLTIPQQRTHTRLVDEMALARHRARAQLNVAGFLHASAFDEIKERLSRR